MVVFNMTFLNTSRKVFYDLIKKFKSISYFFRDP